jgi:hypothetical protein
MTKRGTEQAHRAEDVHLGVEERLGEAAGGVDLRGEVEDRLRTFGEHDRFGGGRRHARDVEPGGGRQVLPAAGREVVEHRDLVPRADEGIDEVAADEAGAAGDEDSHRSSRRCQSRSPPRRRTWRRSFRSS